MSSGKYRKRGRKNGGQGNRGPGRGIPRRSGGGGIGPTGRLIERAYACEREGRTVETNQAGVGVRRRTPKDDGFSEKSATVWRRRPAAGEAATG